MPNIIADVAGEYKTLQALLKQMPDEEPISIGDMIDRGPDSKKVLEFFKKNGKAVMGNHEHQMLDYYNKTKIYKEGVWLFRNGGIFTVNSFIVDETLENIDNEPSEDIINWIASLPIYLTFQDVLISHTYLLEDDYALKDLPSLENDNSILWNRVPPKRRSDYRLQISGHNSHWGLKSFKDIQGTYGLSIDQSSNNILTGINLPSGKVYQQDFIK